MLRTYSPQGIKGDYYFVTAQWEKTKIVGFKIERMYYTHELEAEPNLVQENGSTRRVGDRIFLKPVFIHKGTVLKIGIVKNLHEVCGNGFSAFAVVTVKLTDGNLVQIEAHYLYELIVPEAIQADAA